MPSSESTINYFFKNLKALHSIKDDLDTEYYDGLAEILDKAMQEVSNHTGKFLHKLDEKKPDNETLKQMITSVPSSLSYRNEDGQLPIQSAVWEDGSVRYVPLLAREGLKYNVGGDDERGGLLSDGVNILQHLALMPGIDDTNRLSLDTTDKSYLQAIIDLRELKLLCKQDVKDHNLLYLACQPYRQLRFDYFLDWDPDLLKMHRFKEDPIIHGICRHPHIEIIDCFKVFLKAALKRYPDELGLLFQKDDGGMTGCECAFAKYGKEETLNAIGEFIPFDNPQSPILHHVSKHAPQFMNDFAKKYSSAAYFRDRQGRTLRQASLASGTKTYQNHAMFFIGMSDEEVREIDPGSDLYPFMVAASVDTSDLSAVYNLLRRNPSLARCNRPRRGRKRKKTRTMCFKSSR